MYIIVMFYNVEIRTQHFFLHFFLKNVCEIKFIVYLCNE